MEKIIKNLSFSTVLKFTIPTIIMTIFTSFYTVVDGFFVSNFLGTDALSATTITFPVISIILAISIMFSTGGNAIIAKKMGEGKQEEANSNFTFIVIVVLCIGVISSVILITFIDPIIKFLGATPEIFHYCKQYLFVILIFLTPGIFQMLFQTFFITSGNTKLGLYVSLISGVLNMVLDYVFIVFLNLGIAGAALATSTGFIIPSIVGIIYFSNKKRRLHFVKPRFDFKVLLKSAGNGSSEMVVSLAFSITTIIFNFIMLKYLGVDGVAAVTIVLYVNYFMSSFFMGFSMGVSPLISYIYGLGDKLKLKSVFSISIKFILIATVILIVGSLLLSSTLVKIFAGQENEVYKIALNGYYLYSLGYMFIGINIFSSALFTSLSNGKLSALISVLRTLVFILVGFIVLPGLIGLNGVWLAVPFAEFLTVIVCVLLLIRNKKRYNYF